MTPQMRYISSFSVIVIFISLSLLGLALAPLLPVRLSPSEALPSVSVSFNMQGSSARAVEQEATSRLESALSRVQGVKYVKSRSRTGSGYVRLELDRNTSISTARFETAMIVRQVWDNLPENLSYPYISVSQVDDDASRPFMSYTINADLPAAEIMDYADERLRPALSRIPGVAKVELSGAMPMEWDITYDSDLLAILGLTPDILLSAISTRLNSEFLGTARPADDGNTSWIRVVLVPEADVEGLDISKIVIGSHNGEIITLDKVATIQHAEAPPQSYFRINGLNSINLSITATPAANQIDLSHSVKECLASLHLPRGFMLTLEYDASDRISEELDKIYFRTGLTVLILLLFVAIVTLSWRYLLIITISLAMNLCVAFVAYYLLGVEIQLYSLAGITISLNLIIDNLIVMTEHITRRHNLRAFSAILAATLTTVGALSVVFFLDERTMLSLKDFVVVVIVNLGVSLLVALFLVPALVERIHLRRRVHTHRRFRRLPVATTRAYAATVVFLLRHKAIVSIVFILAFGLPVFMIPDKIEGEGKWAGLYNKTLGSKFYQKDMKPWVDRCLGGTLRLFAEKVSSGDYWGRSNDEPIVYINANLPNGATLSQMNELMKKMEVFLAKEDGIRQFHTSIYSPNRGSITVYFKPDVQRTGYPYRLKSKAVQKALTLGGGSWGVYGLEDMGFNNDVRENTGSYRVKLLGYNYDDLYSYARTLSDTLLTHKRIKEVTLNSEFSYWKDDYTEFYLDFDREKLALDSISTSDIYQAMTREMGRGLHAGAIVTPAGAEAIRVESSGKGRDVWGFMHIPLQVGKRLVRLSDYATIESRQAPPDVVKENQEYVLCLQYEYIGSYTQGQKMLERTLKDFNNYLPLGYTATKEDYSWGREDTKQRYLLLLLIVVIIFFISSILFNSLRQPLAIIFVIPVSFIGVFLTFYLFNLKFDQGGFAAFILLCGVTVNAAIYIINEYNSLRSQKATKVSVRLYVKAFRVKITAVLLTVLSTVLGFIPFLIGETHESFWFPLAAGTMGGLILSLTGIFFLLPIMVLKKPTRSSPQHK